MTADADVRPTQRRWWRRPAVIATAVVLVILAGVTARVFVWPSLPALPEHADAVVELGGLGDRDSVALQLARAHRASFLVQSTVPADTHTGTCLPRVADVTILCIYADPPTTRGEAEYIGRLVAQYHWTSVILVTTPDQAWRARLRVSRCFDGPVYVSTAPLPPLDWFRQIPYQWGASIKALTVERSC